MRLQRDSNYNGLTIILSHPSRFDIKNSKLLSAYAGDWFRGQCLPRAGLKIGACDVKTLEEHKEFLPNTKVVLCLGVKAQNAIMGTLTSIGEQRGSPVEMQNGLIGVSSFPPQDCFDRQDYESRFQAELDGSDDEDDEDATSRHGKTRRANFKFWLQQDVIKVARYLKHGLSRVNTTIHIVNDPLPLLRSHRGVMCHDIETAEDLSVRCFAFSTETRPGEVFAVPMMDYNDNMRPDWPRIMIEYCLAVRRSSMVISHAGTTYDHPVLIWRYKMPFFNWNLYDTLVAQHRLLPEIERSLGHCISLLTDAPYHKDEGVFRPHNSRQDQQLLLYCGKDVAETLQVYHAQRKLIDQDAGLIDSVNIAMQAANAYLITSLAGFPINEVTRAQMYSKRDTTCKILARVAELLLGPQLKSFCSTQKKPSNILASSDQLVRYFHDYLKLKPVAYTDTGRARLRELDIYKLADKCSNNPIMKMVIAYREASKARGDLRLATWYRNFKDWKEAQTTTAITV